MGALASNAAIKHRRDSQKIRLNLTKLVQEVNQIEENKFVDPSAKDKHHGGLEEDPTEKFFGEAIQESVENETGVRNAGWSKKPKNINFISSKPKLVPSHQKDEGMDIVHNADGNEPNKNGTKAENVLSDM